MTDFSCGYDLTCHLAAGRLFTEETGAVILGEVANAYNLFAAALETGLDAVQKVPLLWNVFIREVSLTDSVRLLS